MDSGGLTFARTPRQVATRHDLVMADVGKLDRSLAMNKSYHVGMGGSGPSAIRGRYPEARRFLAHAKAKGVKVHPPEAGIDRKGRAFLVDGRHRFAAIRDSGAKVVPVAVPRGQSRRFAKLFGPN